MADKFKIYVTSKKEEEPVVYEDKFPEGTTLEDLKEQHGVVIWCKYAACINNKQFDDTQRTTGSLRKNTSYKPIGVKDNVWKGVCTRDEIGVGFQEFFSNGAKFKVPMCFNAASNKQGIWISVGSCNQTVHLMEEILIHKVQNMELKLLEYTNA